MNKWTNYSSDIHIKIHQVIPLQFGHSHINIKRQRIVWHINVQINLQIQSVFEAVTSSYYYDYDCKGGGGSRGGEGGTPILEHVRFYCWLWKK